MFKTSLHINVITSTTQTPLRSVYQKDYTARHNENPLLLNKIQFDQNIHMRIIKKLN